MVTSPIRVQVRSMLRAQSAAAWAKRAVQGLLPRLADRVFQPSRDPTFYVQCAVPPQWKRWCLPADTHPVDLSRFVFRLHRAIGGSWTEKLHADAALQRLANAWALHRNLHSPRLCPLCGTGPGTPRHVVMSCPAMSPLVDQLRDAIEAELCCTVAKQSLANAGGRVCSPSPLAACPGAAWCWRKMLMAAAPRLLPES